MNKRTVIFLVLILALLFSSTLFGQESKSTAAVMDLSVAEGISQKTSMLLSDYLRTQLFQLDKYTLVTRENMETILKEQKFQLSGCTSTECVVQAGKLLGVQKMFAGSVGKVGNTYLLTLKLLNVETGKQENVITEECSKCEEESLIPSIRNIVKRVCGIEVVGISKERLEVKEPVHVSNNILDKTLVTFNVFNLDLKEALNQICAAAGLNIVLSAGISGKVTMNVKDIPLRQVLGLIVDANGLEYAEKDNIIRIMTPDEVKKALDGLVAQNENDSLSSQKQSDISIEAQVLKITYGIKKGFFTPSKNKHWVINCLLQKKMLKTVLLRAPFQASWLAESKETVWFSLTNRDFSAIFNALATGAEVRLLQSPRIMSISGIPAIIDVADNQAQIRLTLTPVINNENIVLKLNLEIGENTGYTSTNTPLSTSIYRTDYAATVERGESVIFLVPTGSGKQESQLVFFVTPKLIK